MYTMRRMWTVTSGELPLSATCYMHDVSQWHDTQEKVRSIMQEGRGTLNWVITMDNVTHQPCNKLNSSFQSGFNT
jgi:hypothetical protein